MFKYLITLTSTFLMTGCVFAINSKFEGKPNGDGPKGPPSGAGWGNRPPLRPKLTEEQIKQRQSIIKKYDTNKNGRLDEQERKNVSEEDRKILRSFGPPPGGSRGPRNKPTPINELPVNPNKKATA